MKFQKPERPVQSPSENVPYHEASFLTPLRFDLESPAWLSTITTSTPSVPPQARTFALAGLRLFLDFFQHRIKKPRAIQTRGFLLTTAGRQ